MKVSFSSDAMHATSPVWSSARIHDLVGEGVELLDRLAVHVLVPCGPQDVDEPGLVHLAPDHLGRQRDVVEQIRELAGRVGMLPLLLDQEAGDGEHVAVWHRGHRSL
jgi:hypothetical protein